MFDLNVVNDIKKIAIIAIVSDDFLMETLILKGGNAMDIIYKIPASRASIDLDYSICNEFKKEELPMIEEKINHVLYNTFKENGYQVFDIKFVEKPKVVSSKNKNFWGGYQVEFKVTDLKTFDELSNNKDKLRKQALIIGSKNKRKFTIDISKFEYCHDKQKSDLEGYTIYVYSPEMIVFEKLRALCQQMPEYIQQLKGFKEARATRAKDFFDIFLILEKFRININQEKNKTLLENIFSAKKVPLSLIGKIETTREFHRPDFKSVENTIKPGVPLKSYDFYFDYVVDKFSVLESFWKE